jgi:hypothetical protein
MKRFYFIALFLALCGVDEFGPADEATSLRSFPKY